MFSQADKLWLKFFSELNEAQRRRYAAQRALELKWGGVSHICKLTGMSHHTVNKGIDELTSKKIIPTDRLRKKGGGRKKLIDKNPRIKKEIKQILEKQNREYELNTEWLKTLEKFSTETRKAYENKNLQPNS